MWLRKPAFLLLLGLASCVSNPGVAERNQPANPTPGYQTGYENRQYGLRFVKAGNGTGLYGNLFTFSFDK